MATGNEPDFAAGRQKRATPQRLSRQATVLRRQLIPFAGRFSSTPLHDPVERLEIRARLRVLEEARSLQSPNLFRNGGSHKLIID